MKVYLAAAFSRRHELREYTSRGNGIGVENVGEWIYHDPPAGDADLARWAQRQLDALHRAQALVLFTGDSAGDPEVLFGAALAQRKTLLVVGPLLDAFHHAGGVRHFESYEAALEFLRPKSEYQQPGFFDGIDTRGQGE